jgi:hypothetical protein
MAPNKRKKAKDRKVSCKKTEETAKAVAGPRPYIYKSDKLKNNRNGGRKRKVLLVVAECDRNWAKESISNNKTELTVVYIKNYQDVMRVLFTYSCNEFDAVILAPCHGLEEMPKVKWGPHQAPTFIYPCVLRAFKIAVHVHICTCYQGKTCFMMSMNE